MTLFSYRLFKGEHTFEIHSTKNLGSLQHMMRCLFSSHRILLLCLICFGMSWTISGIKAQASNITPIPMENLNPRLTGLKTFFFLDFDFEALIFRIQTNRHRQRRSDFVQ